MHTNQNLFLAAGNGSTLTFRDKITAFTQVVRNTLRTASRSRSAATQGTVSIPTVIGGAPATIGISLDTESSGTTGRLPCVAGWKNLSEVTYRTNIRTEATGAKQLNLPLMSQGATPIDLIRRPASARTRTWPIAAVFGQRYFAQASLRILLSDRAADLTNLPTITAGAPLQLDRPLVQQAMSSLRRPGAARAGRIAQSPGPSRSTRRPAHPSTRVSAICRRHDPDDCKPRRRRTARRLGRLADAGRRG